MDFLRPSVSNIVAYPNPELSATSAVLCFKEISKEITPSLSIAAKREIIGKSIAQQSEHTELIAATEQAALSLHLFALNKTFVYRQPKGCIDDKELQGIALGHPSDTKHDLPRPRSRIIRENGNCTNVHR